MEGNAKLPFAFSRWHALLLKLKRYERLESQMKHVQHQQVANHKAMVSLNGSFHSYALHHSGQRTSVWPTAEEFDHLVHWPGDKTVFAAYSEENHEEIHDG
ncbi:hypothetical protein VNO80_03321 [Phaseolus coccineus]|uniref:Uncharacterized protein n=1 Tax=Phaseolus coccineus TaxID=3886 RepID=A0AAN9NYG8_PHACN